MGTSGFAKILILTTCIAWVISLVVVPLVRSLAHRIGLVDRPDPTRKLHRGNIALGGGVAVLLSGIVTALCAHYWIVPAFRGAGLIWNQRWTGIAIGAVLITLLGVVDDRFAMRGKQKLVGQVAIVFLMALMWEPKGQIQLFGWAVDLGVLAVPLLMLWLLAAINAVNLIDGADGVTGSFGFVAAMGIALVAFVNGQLTVAVLAAALGASLAGFLCFNRPPASIFLGDAGSMLAGLLLGAFTCLAVERSGRAQDVLIPVTLLGVPLFDSVVAILRRVLTGRSIYMPDRGHLHHILGAHLKARGLSPMWMIVFFGGLAAVTSAGAVVGAVFASDAVAILTISLVISGLVWSRTFGHAEARLLASHTRRWGGSIVSRVRKAEPKAHVAGVPLQGNREWDGVWEPLVEFAERNGLWQLKLDLNMPWQHEGYHGLWSCGRMPEKSEQWSVRLPLICHRRTVGRLEIVGQAEGESQLESLEAFSFLISELQPAIEQLVCSISVTHEEQVPAVPAPAMRKPEKELAGIG